MPCQPNSSTKTPTVTAVVVEEIDPAKWFISDRSLMQHRLASFWIDVRVVESTNTREQKATFLAAAFARMGELLGPLHPESYAHDAPRTASASRSLPNSFEDR